MADLKQNSADFVLAHLLTKPENLAQGDIRAVQRALIEKIGAEFQPNGVFGPGTSEKVMEYLKQEPGIQLVAHLSDDVRKSLIKHDHQEELAVLSAAVAGATGSVLNPKTIEDLISAPYTLSKEDVKDLQGLLKIHPDGDIGRDTILAVNDYIKSHPQAVLINPDIVEHMTRGWDSWHDTTQAMAVNSSTYKAMVEELYAANTGSTPSSTNYMLQYMLYAGGFGDKPDSGVGPATERDMNEFRAAVSGKQSALRQQWDSKDVATVGLDQKAPDPAVQVDTPKLV